MPMCHEEYHRVTKKVSGDSKGGCSRGRVDGRLGGDFAMASDLG